MRRKTGASMAIDHLADNSTSRGFTAGGGWNERSTLRHAVIGGSRAGGGMFSAGSLQSIAAASGYTQELIWCWRATIPPSSPL